MLVITSEEINSLIKNYLIEEGYYHTLFVFSNESLLKDVNVRYSLKEIIKKGTQHIFLEEHITEGKLKECTSKYSLSEEHVCSELFEEIVSDLSEEKVVKYAIAPLDEHTGDVSLCAWNRDILATGSNDATIRTYKNGRLVFNKKVTNEITAIAWSSDFLSVGTYDGEVISYQTENLSAESRHHYHRGPVFSLKYRDNSLLSGSCDGKIAILNSGVTLIPVHKSIVFDVDWINDDLVCTCSSDASVAVVNLNSKNCEYFYGHEKEVNCVSHKDGMIASSSDDTTLRIWNIESKQGVVFEGHTKSVYAHKWISRGIASVGSDALVKIWDVEKNVCVNTYKHEQAVHTVDYSHNRNLLVTGALDKRVIFWDPRVGEVGMYEGKARVHEVRFSGSENLLCICSSENVPVVLDLRFS